jgi:hypothetical protein
MMRYETSWAPCLEDWWSEVQIDSGIGMVLPQASGKKAEYHDFDVTGY